MVRAWHHAVVVAAGGRAYAVGVANLVPRLLAWRTIYRTV